MCNSELRSFEKSLPQFDARGVRVAAISVDPPEESRSLRQSQGYTFPFLSDPMANTIRAYGVLHEQGREDGYNIARPAEFLVDQTGTIRWQNVARSLVERLRPETALRGIDGLPASSRRERLALRLSNAVAGRVGGPGFEVPGHSVQPLDQFSPGALCLFRRGRCSGTATIFSVPNQALRGFRGDEIESLRVMRVGAFQKDVGGGAVELDAGGRASTIAGLEAENSIVPPELTALHSELTRS